VSTQDKLASLSDSELAELKDQANHALWQTWLHAASPEELLGLIQAIEADKKASNQATREAEALQALGVDAKPWNGR
jgi:hypothetical protein